MDETRLIESLPCISDLSQNSKQLIIMAHLGRPKIQSSEYDLAKICESLSWKLGKDIFFVENLSEENITRIKSWEDHIVFYKI